MIQREHVEALTDPSSYSNAEHSQVTASIDSSLIPTVKKDFPYLLAELPQRYDM